MKSLLDRKQEFINKAKRKYGELYDYSKVNYAGKNKKVRIFCTKHNTWFFQTPALHLLGTGCSDCAREKMSKSSVTRKIDWNSEEVLLNLQNLLDLGKTFEEIGKILKISGHQVGVVVKKYSLKINNPSFIEKQKIENYLNLGYNLQQISKILGVTSSAVSYKLKKYNLKIPSKFEKNNISKDYILSLLDKGMSLKEISKEINISTYILRKFIKENNIKILIKKDLNKLILEIKELASLGNNLNKISTIVGLSRPTLSKLVTEFNIDMPRGSIAFNKEEIEGYILEGYSNKEIALFLGIQYPETITRFEKRVGLVNPNKALSSGEIFVKKFLEDNKIPYEHCKYYSSIEGRKINRVFIDFVIKDYKNTTYWIEYNGLQHYKKVQRFHKTTEDFKRQLTRDNNIREYCSENGIKFIEIPYLLKNFEQISEFLNKVLILDLDPNQLIDYSNLYK